MDKGRGPKGASFDRNCWRATQVTGTSGTKMGHSEWSQCPSKEHKRVADQREHWSFQLVHSSRCDFQVRWNPTGDLTWTQSIITHHEILLIDVGYVDKAASRGLCCSSRWSLQKPGGAVGWWNITYHGWEFLCIINSLFSKTKIFQLVDVLFKKISAYNCLHLRSRQNTDRQIDFLRQCLPKEKEKSKEGRKMSSFLILQAPWTIVLRISYN